MSERSKILQWQLKLKIPPSAIMSDEEIEKYLKGVFAQGEFQEQLKNDPVGLVSLLINSARQYDETQLQDLLNNEVITKEHIESAKNRRGAVLQKTTTDEEMSRLADFMRRWRNNGSEINEEMTKLIEELDVFSNEFPMIYDRYLLQKRVLLRASTYYTALCSALTRVILHILGKNDLILKTDEQKTKIEQEIDDLRQEMAYLRALIVDIQRQKDLKPIKTAEEEIQEEAEGLDDEVPPEDEENGT